MGELPDPNLVRLLAGAVLKFHPESSGWRMVSIRPQGLGAEWVHMRPYLGDEGMAHGYRVEPDGRAPLELCEEPSYPNLFVRWDGGDIPTEVYELLGDAERRQIPWLMVEVSSGSEALSLYDKSDGSRKSLSGLTRPSSVRPLTLNVEGSRAIELSEFLPFDVQVSSNTHAAAFSVNVKTASAKFSRRAYHFTLAEAGRKPLGSGALRVNVRCRVGQPDDLVVTALDFKGGVVVREQEFAAAGRQRPPRFSPGTVQLHVVFDRTTLDADAWPVALAALGGLVEESGDEMYSRGESGQQSWNQHLREALAEALAHAVGEFHGGDVLFHLWWFADMPRPGVASIRNIPVLRVAHGGGEQCSADELRGQLCSPMFEYAPGLDLFDAADEALQRVAAHIAPTARHSAMQHAVLVVGDSPPPPADKQDVLWTALVDGPPRTNARCSPRFRDALRSLHEMRVPVGWLFMRPGIPTSKAGYREYENQFQYFGTLRKNVLNALHQIDGLKVEDCRGTADIGRALRDLLAQLAEKDPAVPALYFGDVVPR